MSQRQRLPRPPRLERQGIVFANSCFMNPQLQITNTPMEVAKNMGKAWEEEWRSSADIFPSD